MRTRSKVSLAITALVCSALALTARAQDPVITWEPLATIDAPDGGAPPHGSAVASDAGVIHMTWKRGSQARYARSLDYGATWQDDVALSTNSDSGTGWVAASGSVILAAWYEVVGSDRQLVSAHSTDGGLSWGTAQAISPVGTFRGVDFAFSGALAAGAWTVDDGSVVTYYVSTSQDAGITWDAAVTAVTTDRFNTWPGGVQVAVSANNLVVMYSDSDKLSLTASADMGSTWGAPTHPVTGGPSYQPRSMATDGSIVLAQYLHFVTDFEEEQYVVRSTDGGITWESAVNVSAGIGLYDALGAVEIEGGVAASAWRHSDSAGASKYAATALSLDGGQTWGAAQVEVTAAVDVNYNDVTVEGSTVVLVGYSGAASGGIYAYRGALPGAAVSITSPTSDEALPAGTTTQALTLSISGHNSPGYWAWRADVPFPDTGAAPADATSVPTGDTDTIPALTDSTTHTVYVALVDGTTDQLLDATTEPGSRADVTFHVGPPTIAITAPAGVLPSGTTSVAVTANIAAHPTPGYWVWQLDAPFPASGAAGGIVGDTVPIDGLEDGDEHTVYAALVDSGGNLLSPSITHTSDFVVGLPPDAVQVMDTQGGGTTVTVPIEIYDVSTLDVAGVDMIVAYDSAILTPADDGAGNITAVQTGTAVVPAEWYVDQNVVTPGELIVSMASDFATYLIGAGALITVEFDVAAEATAGTVTTIGITGLELNEGTVPASTVAGTFTVLDIVYGDVTGNESVGAFDAAWVLEYVANELIGTTIQFPIETSTPPWASLPLTAAEAREVADVDDSGAPQGEPVDIAAIDASQILQKRVGKIVLFVAEGGTPQAPSSQPSVLAYGLRGASTSSRPGAQVTISLDASTVEELYAGELRLDFDPALLRLTDVTLRGGGDASQRPLLAHRMGDGQVAVAFASARPIESTDSTLDVTFQVTRQIGEPTEGTIRSSHLRLNGVRVDTGFSYPFRAEPYTFQLMSNYPNPFNPETWIPFELSQDADVTVRIYALNGKTVRTLDLGYQPMGEYRARETAAYWDGANEQGERVASGVYVYELVAGEHHALRRMVVMK